MGVFILQKAPLRAKDLDAEQRNFVFEALSRCVPNNKIVDQLRKQYNVNVTTACIRKYRERNFDKIKEARERLEKEIKHEIPIANVVFRQQLRQNLIEYLINKMNLYKHILDEPVENGDDDEEKKGISKDLMIIKTINDLLNSASNDMIELEGTPADAFLTKIMRLTSNPGHTFIVKGDLSD